MKYTNEFRLRLASSILVAVAGGAQLLGGCSGDTQQGGGGTGGTGGSGGTIDDGSYTANDCFAWPQLPDGGAGANGGAGGAAGAAGAGGNAGAAGMGGAGGTGGAMPVTCPGMAEAAMYVTTLQCGGQVTSEGTLADGKCCYDVYHSGCGVGRPYMAEGKPQSAKAQSSNKGWMMDLVPSVENLSADERARLAAAYLDDALLEHASIASFGRFALELLAVGAPSELLVLAHSAALDEVQHAKLTFGLASAYAGKTFGPRSFPFDGAVVVSAELADVAARAVREGCIGETLASLMVAEQAQLAEDPAVRAVLSAIAEDEARHAELAWKTVAWAVSTGDADVRKSVADAFEQALLNDVVFDVPTTGNAVLEKHGRPAADVLRRAIRRGIEDVVRPAARALLAS